MKKETILPTEVIFNHAEKHYLVAQILKKERLDHIAAKLCEILIAINNEEYFLRLRRHDHSATLCFHKKIGQNEKVWMFSIDCHQFKRQSDARSTQELHSRFPKSEMLSGMQYPVHLLPALIDFCNAHLPKEMQLYYPLYGVKEKIA
jgi:hypothetical protein